LGAGSSDCHHRKTAVHDFLVLDLVDYRLRLVLEVAISEAKVTGRSARSLQHFGDSEPRDDFGKTDEDEGISHHTIVNHDVVGSARAESRAKRVHNDSLINDNISDNSHLGDTAVPSSKEDLEVS
jgi:hypothetical protein